MQQPKMAIFYAKLMTIEINSVTELGTVLSGSMHHWLTFYLLNYAVASNRYDNPSGGTIEVISPASSPVQPQQDKPEERQPQPPGERRVST